MGDPIYIVDPSNGQSVRAAPVSLSEIGVRERKDLEQWISNHPELLGEPLLVLTSEFSGFDKSSRRLDLLALDKQGVLVVIELKLDIAGTVADQQAIRYAAFCSTMTMCQAVDLYADYQACSVEDAERRVLEFLQFEELPELNDRPRIILAAGSIEDQELTTCVLWLRRFGVDITCVELTPYRVPGSAQIVLVPRTVIPPPEARDYVVKVEQKEATKAQDQKVRAATRDLWHRIRDEFEKLACPLKTFKVSDLCLQLPVGVRNVHYEWMLRRRDKCLDVAVHFESDDLNENQRQIAPLEASRDAIQKDVSFRLDISRWRRSWMQARFPLPYEGTEPTADIAPKAAALMKVLVDRTYSMLSNGLGD